MCGIGHGADNDDKGENNLACLEYHIVTFCSEVANEVSKSFERHEEMSIVR
jgi:hypothetical protein